MCAVFTQLYRICVAIVFFCFDFGLMSWLHTYWFFISINIQKKKYCRKTVSNWRPRGWKTNTLTIWLLAPTICTVRMHSLLCCVCRTFVLIFLLLFMFCYGLTTAVICIICFLYQKSLCCILCINEKNKHSNHIEFKISKNNLSFCHVSWNTFDTEKSKIEQFLNFSLNLEKFIKLSWSFMIHCQTEYRIIQENAVTGEFCLKVADLEFSGNWIELISDFYFELEPVSSCKSIMPISKRGKSCVRHCKSITHARRHTQQNRFRTQNTNFGSDAKEQSPNQSNQ
jgi:hypothetical protein